MKRYLALAVPLCCLVFVLACGPSASTTDSAEEPLGEPTELADKVAYSMGVNIGSSLKQQDVELDIGYILRGLEDAMGGGELLLTQEEMGQSVQEFQQQMAQEAGDRNQTEGEAFLAGNAEREEVTTLPSGLQYEVLQEGDGPQPAATDRVTVHYRGSLVDETQFDSSYDRGQPATFRLDQVIPGWSEGLQLMSVGSVWKLYVPGDLAYGANPPPGSPIGPNSTLVFEVELLDIEDSEN